MKTLTKILLVIGITTLIFTIAMIVLFILYQQIPDTLVDKYFTCVVGECGVTGIIQITKEITKHKYKGNNEETEDDSEEELSDTAEAILELSNLENEQKGDEEE